MPSKSKRRFPIQPDRYKDLYGFDKEFNAESDRGKVILGAARLDDLLRELIAGHLVQDKEMINNLFDGQLQSLGNKISIAYGMGLITSNERHNLRQIQNIRNAFAHNLHDISFDNEWVSSLCEKIKIPENSTIPGAVYSASQKFRVTVMQLDFQLQYRIEEAFTHPNSPSDYIWEVSGDGMASIK